jgi:hypothetical protein
MNSKENKISLFENILNSSEEELNRKLQPVIKQNIESKFKNAYGDAAVKISEYESSIIDGFKRLKDNYKSYDVNSSAEKLFRIEELRSQQKGLKDLYKLLFSTELQINDLEIPSILDSI